MASLLENTPRDRIEYNGDMFLDEIDFSFDDKSLLGDKLDVKLEDTPKLGSPSKQIAPESFKDLGNDDEWMESFLNWVDTKEDQITDFRFA